jgi:hypothetical protein
MELMLRVALALKHAEFGIKVDSFTPQMVLEWTEKWLQIDQLKDVDHLLGLLVKQGFLNEKGSKTNKGYELDHRHISEISRLMRK